MVVALEVRNRNEHRTPRDPLTLGTFPRIPGGYSADYVGNAWVLPRQELNSAFMIESQRLNDLGS